jgi:hypothetical protein
MALLFQLGNLEALCCGALGPIDYTATTFHYTVFPPASLPLSANDFELATFSCWVYIFPLGF